MPGAESTTGRVEGDEDKEIWGLQFFGGGGVVKETVVKNGEVSQE